MAVRLGPHGFYIALAADTKPLTVAVGSVLYETDTGIRYIFNGTAWVVFYPTLIGV